MKGIGKKITGSLKALRMKQIDITLILAIVVIVLVNLVGQGAYLRSDLTDRNVYSLTPMSTELMDRIDRPMKVKIYFTKDVPAQYTAVRRYVQDIMRQYDRAAGTHFSYEIYSMKTAQQQQEASEYGVQPVQIREIRGNEFQQTRAYMSAVFLYGDRIEKIDGITSTKGLEYDATTTMLDMINSVNAFAGLEQPINVTAYVSENLTELQISGIEKIVPNLRDMLKKVNEQTGGQLKASIKQPASQERIEELEDQYGLQTVQWQSRGESAAATGTESTESSGEEGAGGEGSGGEGSAGEASGEQQKGLMGLVLEYRDRTKTVPIHITGSIFGYELEKMGEVRKNVEEKLSALVQSNPPVAYITGHGEKLLEAPRRARQQASAGTFKKLLNELYQVRTVALPDNPIPDDVQLAIINGPRKDFTERELYKLDQFLMRGGSLMILADPFRTIRSRRSRRPQYKPVNTGLGELLESYGITLKENFVMDTRAYVNRQQNRQDVKLHNAPLVEGESLNDTHLITKDLARVLYLNTSSVGYPGAESGEESDSGGGDAAGGISYTELASSSENSWLMEEDITLNPMMVRPPQGDTERKAYPITVLAEGRFTSHFDKAVPPAEDGGSESSEESTEGDQAAESRSAENRNAEGSAIEQTTPHLQQAKEPGKLLVAGTSALTGSQLLGNQPQRGSNPNRILVQNMADYMNGNTNIPPMRTKGLQMHRLGETTAAERTLIRMIHVVVVPVIIIGIGIGTWLRRRRYQRSIREMMEREAEV